MAEAVGLVASIVGVVGAATRVSMTLFGIADALGSAGWEARAIASELSLFSQSLKSLRKSIRFYAPKSHLAKRAAKEMIDASRGLINDLQEILKDVVPREDGRSRRKDPAIGARLKWLFKKDRVSFILRTLESYKSSLLLLIASLDYSQAREEKAPPEHRRDLKDEVENLMRASETTASFLVYTSKAYSESDDSAPPGDVDLQGSLQMNQRSSESSGARNQLMQTTKDIQAAVDADDGHLISQCSSVLVKGRTLNLHPQHLAYRAARESLDYDGDTVSREDVPRTAPHSPRARPSTQNAFENDSGPYQFTSPFRTEARESGFNSQNWRSSQPPTEDDVYWNGRDKDTRRQKPAIRRYPVSEGARIKRSVHWEDSQGVEVVTERRKRDSERDEPKSSARRDEEYRRSAAFLEKRKEDEWGEAYALTQFWSSYRKNSRRSLPRELLNFLTGSQPWDQGKEKY